MERVPSGPTGRRFERIGSDTAVHHRIAKIGSIKASLFPALPLCLAQRHRAMLPGEGVELKARVGDGRRLAFEAGNQRAGFLIEAAIVEVELRKSLAKRALFPKRSEGAIESRLGLVRQPQHRGAHATRLGLADCGNGACENTLEKIARNSFFSWGRA